MDIKPELDSGRDLIHVLPSRAGRADKVVLNLAFVNLHGGCNLDHGLSISGQCIIIPKEGVKLIVVVTTLSIYTMLLNKIIDTFCLLSYIKITLLSSIL